MSNVCSIGDVGSRVEHNILQTATFTYRIVDPMLSWSESGFSEGLDPYLGFFWRFKSGLFEVAPKSDVSLDMNQITASAYLQCVIYKETFINIHVYILKP